jgi:hypothetical protein
VLVTEEQETFDSREEAEARCRELERETGSTWLAYPAEGRWRIAGTNLPRQAPPGGTASESKPKPPEPDDPRSGPGRDLPGTGYL